LESEQHKRRAFAGGSLSLDLMDLRSRLQTLGVVYVDETVAQNVRS
jgi:hypothetical protein